VRGSLLRACAQGSGHRLLFRVEGAAELVAGNYWWQVFGKYGRKPAGVARSISRRRGT
jgi:hypothetical protein